jgi:uncharacterized membrane protein YgcG
MPQPLATDAQRVQRRKPHYIAATVYLLLAFFALIAAFSGKPSTLIVTLLAGAYSAYLYRGGRVVVWFW